MKTIQRIAEEIRRAQIYPATTRVELNDKISNILFSLTDREYKHLRSGKTFTVIESKVKGDTVESYFKLRSDSDEPPTEIDRNVFNVCNSEFKAGNLYTTPSIIYRALTGKIGDSDANPSKNQVAAIRQSITKLRRTDFIADVKDAFAKLKYDDVTLRIKESSILPCVVLDAFINGQQVEDAIYFLGESPLWAIADTKDQVIRYDARLLNIPNQNNTPRVIMLTNYVFHRVFEIIAHNMAPTVTFDDIFEKVRISDTASRDTKKEIRNTVKAVFEHLQTNGVIKSFTPVKKGVTVYGISFTF